jgi:two-component sensor histidine kinase
MVTPFQDVPTTVPRSVIVTPQQTRSPTLSPRDWSPGMCGALVSGTDWQLAVSDNGSGKPDGVFAQPKTGLGTGVVKALSKQLDAQVVTVSGALGTKVSIAHATFAAA